MSNTLCPNPCETCDKRGLPILLVRHAVVPNELPTPALAGNFADATTSSIQLGTHAKYTQRLLRSGYVYVYDERYANQWDEYFVTNDGHLTKLPLRMVCSPIPPKPPATEFACARTGARPMASVITIRNPKHAKTLWLSFSDTQWTDDLMKRHNDAGYRAKHMTKISVSGGKIAPQKHAEPLEQLRELLPEYGGKLGSELYKKLLHASPFQFNHRDREWQSLMDAYQAMRPEGGGAVVVLNDPVSIAVELGQLMQHRITVWKNRPEVRRQLFVSAKVEEIKIGVIEAAETAEFLAAQQVSNQMLAQPDMGMLFKGYREKRVAQIENIAKLSPAQRDKVGADAWKKYTDKFDYVACQQWRETFNKELVNYENEHIGPLAKAHAKWMQSELMVRQFELNHDDADFDSGVAYADTLALCIATTQDKMACHEVYDTWFQSSAPKRENLLLNALLLNHKVSIEQVKEAIAASPVDWNGLPWDKLVEGCGQATEKALEGRPDVIGKLIGLVAGSVVSAMTKAASTSKVYFGLVAMSAASGKPMVLVERTDTKVQFRRALFTQIRKATGSNVPGKTLERIVDAEVERLKAQGVDLTGNETRKWLLMLDPEELKAMPKGISVREQAKWLTARYKTPETVNAINLQEWRMRVSAASGEVVSKGKAWSPSGYALLGLLANVAALSNIQTDDAKVLKQNLPENMRRYYAQWAQVVGATAQAIEEVLKKLAVGSVRIAVGLKNMWGRLLGAFGTRLGAAGSLAMAWIDFERGLQERREMNYASATGYFVSSGLGVLAVAFLLFVPGPWWIVVIAAMFIWAFIKPEDDNKIQDWLERVYQWGKLSNEWYPTPEMEIQQFEVALKK